MRDNPLAKARGLSPRTGRQTMYYIVVVVVLLFNVHGKHLRSYRDGREEDDG